MTRNGVTESRPVAFESEKSFMVGNPRSEQAFLPVFTMKNLYDSFPAKPSGPFVTATCKSLLGQIVLPIPAYAVNGCKVA